jgi:hypothetical protein
MRFFLNASLHNLFPITILQTNAGSELDLEDEQVCCEALEVMTLCFALIPTALDALSKEKAWQTFIIDLLLHCHSKYVSFNCKKLNLIFVSKLFYCGTVYPRNQVFVLHWY